MNNSDLIDYWQSAGTPLGRAKLNLRLRAKRSIWSITIVSAHLAKRTVDVLASLCALVLLAPVFLGTAVLIKFEDGGGIFFRQQRVGLKGRLFGMWKFRSMVVNAERLKDQLIAKNEMQGGVTFKMKNDPRVTRVGRFIRKYSVDELPQFWNVLIGDMSLVGPRPPVPREVALYSPEERQRLLVVPGLTCFWQVGGRSSIDFSGQVRLDIAYIQSSSLWLDLKLLMQTVPAVVFGKGAF